MTDSKDEINPDHYRSHPSGVECIDVVEHLPYNIGAAIKYLWRCDLKHDEPDTDLQKAIWYIQRETERSKNMPKSNESTQ